MSTFGWGTGPWGSTPWGGFTIEQFLKDFPEFDTSGVTDPNAVVIPQSSINYWAQVAGLMLNPQRWDTLLMLGTELFVAHHVALETLAQRDMQVGGVPGVAAGVIAGKSAGDVTISYDTGSVLEPGAGHWNYTIFGKRFYALTQMIGAGPLQVGNGGSVGGFGAWAGPWPWNFPNQSG